MGWHVDPLPPSGETLGAGSPPRRRLQPFVLGAHQPTAALPAPSSRLLLRRHQLLPLLLILLLAQLTAPNPVLTDSAALVTVAGVYVFAAGQQSLLGVDNLLPTTALRCVFDEPRQVTRALHVAAQGAYVLCELPPAADRAAPRRQVVVQRDSTDPTILLGPAALDLQGPGRSPALSGHYAPVGFPYLAPMQAALQATLQATLQAALPAETAASAAERLCICVDAPLAPASPLPFREWLQAHSDIESLAHVFVYTQTAQDPGYAVHVRAAAAANGRRSIHPLPWPAAADPSATRAAQRVHCFLLARPSCPFIAFLSLDEVLHATSPALSSLLKDTTAAYSLSTLELSPTAPPPGAQQLAQTLLPHCSTPSADPRGQILGSSITLLPHPAVDPAGRFVLGAEKQSSVVPAPSVVLHFRTATASCERPFTDLSHHLRCRHTVLASGDPHTACANEKAAEPDLLSTLVAGSVGDQSWLHALRRSIKEGSRGAAALAKTLHVNWRLVALPSSTPRRMRFARVFHCTSDPRSAVPHLASILAADPAAGAKPVAVATTAAAHEDASPAASRASVQWVLENLGEGRASQDTLQAWPPLRRALHLWVAWNAAAERMSSWTFRSESVSLRALCEHTSSSSPSACAGVSDQALAPSPDAAASAPSEPRLLSWAELAEIDADLAAEASRMAQRYGYPSKAEASSGSKQIRSQAQAIDLPAACAPVATSLADYARLHAAILAGQAPQRFLVHRPLARHGTGNRMLAIRGSLALAMLTGRALFVDYPHLHQYGLFEWEDMYLGPHAVAWYPLPVALKGYDRAGFARSRHVLCQLPGIDDMADLVCDTNDTHLVLPRMTLADLAFASTDVLVVTHWNTDYFSKFIVTSKDPALAEAIAARALRDEAFAGCAYRALFKPLPPLRTAFCAARRRLYERIPSAVAVHIRTLEVPVDRWEGNARWRRIKDWLARALGEYKACAEALSLELGSAAAAGLNTTQWFVAADQRFVIDDVLERFGSRRVVSLGLDDNIHAHTGNRGGMSGRRKAVIVGPLVDMLLLAEASVLLGTYHSTYTQLAADIGLLQPNAVVLFDPGFGLLKSDQPHASATHPDPHGECSALARLLAPQLVRSNSARTSFIQCEGIE